jgi:PAS domain-containing protein
MNKPNVREKYVNDLSQSEVNNDFPSDGFDLSFQFIKNLPMGVLIVDHLSVIRWVNDAALRIFGVERQNLIGVHIEDTASSSFSIDNKPILAKDLPAIISLTTGKPVKDVLIKVFLTSPNKPANTLSDLEYRLVNLTSTPVFTEGKTKPTQVYVLAEDVTEKLEVEQTLLHNHEKYIELFSNIPAQTVI